MARRRSGLPILEIVMLILAGLSGLAGDLAADTVKVSWSWWPHFTWALVAGLILAAVLVAWRRYKPDLRAPSKLQVFGAIPQLAQHLQARTEEIQQLRDALGRKGKAALAALPGQRGAGKSQLAAMYAHECVRADYDLVAWINAETGPVSDLSLLAQQLGIAAADPEPSAQAAAVCSWLQNQAEGRRLLVYDNVDDPDALMPFIPRAGSAKVIVTTNRQEFAEMAGFTAVRMGMFTPEQGQAYLESATRLPRNSAAAALGEELGWLPLGLAQAAAYLAISKISYAQYLQLLANQPLDETLRRRAGTEHPGVLKATQLSMTGLMRTDPVGDAVRLLTTLSLLSPDGISRWLLTKAETELKLVGGVNQAIDILATASLVSLSGDADTKGDGDNVVISVHRLTARVIRFQASLGEVAQTATNVLDHLTQGFPDSEAAHRRAEFDELVAHILALRNHLPDPDELLLQQVSWASNALIEVGDLSRALPLTEKLTADYRRVLGADHLGTFATRHNLASAYISSGRGGEAIELLTTLLEDERRVRGSDHQSTLACRNNLAHAYKSSGHLDRAISMFTQVLADRLRILGRDHRDTLSTGSDLAFSYSAAGRLDVAISMYERVLADRQRVLGAEDPDTLLSRNNLAYAHLKAGPLDRAISMFEELLPDLRRVLGDGHQDTMLSEGNLGQAYLAAGRLSEAIPIFVKVLADRRKYLSDGHPETFTAVANLAMAYQAAGSLAEAIALYERAVNDHRRVFAGVDSPETLAMRFNLAGAYKSAGRADEAKLMFAELVTDGRRVLSPDHPLLEFSLAELASAR